MSTTAELIEVAEAAELLGVSVRTLRHRCAEGKVPGAVKQDGGWRIPRCSDTRLHGVESPEHKGLDQFADIPADKIEEAQKRAGLIVDAEKFTTAFVREGGNYSDAMATFCRQKDIGRNTLYRWVKVWRFEGLLGLVDRRGKGRFNSDLISADAWAWFCSEWLVLQQPSVKMIWHGLGYYNTKHNLGWTIPSLRTMYDLVDRKIPEASQVLLREGNTAYEARFAPYILTDPDSIQPGEVWVGDHHEFDCWIRHRGKWVRPWITAWEDRRSRAIVGHCVCISPNQTTVLLAMRKGIDQYGPPKAVKIDNGKDYDSQMWTGVTKTQRRILKSGYLDVPVVKGLYAMMGVTVSFAIPFNAKAKPIERWFATLEGQFVKTMPTYCGRTTASRPETLQQYLQTNEAISKAKDLESFTALVDRYIAAYNATAHTGDGMDERSPNEVMATRQGRRTISQEVLDLMCRVWSGELTVGKNGVKFRDQWYGQFEPILLMKQGKKVVVSYDPENLSSVEVYEAGTYHHIVTADQARMIAYGVGVDEESLREAQASKARARKLLKSVRGASRSAQMNTTDLAIEMMVAKSQPEPEPTHTPTVQPVPSAFDGQVTTIRNRKVARAVRKAAGAEQVTHVTDLKLDWRDLKQDEPTDTTDYGFDFRKMKRREETVDLRLFNG